MAIKPYGGGNCSIFVGNLPYDANEDDMKDIFSRAGQVTSVRIAVDRDTKMPRGFAFIDFSDAKGAQAAMETLTGHDYNGRKLRIDTAERDGGMRGMDGPSGPGGRGPAQLGRGPPDPMPMPPPMPTVADKMAQLKEQEALEKAKAAAQEEADRGELARIMETLSPTQLLQIVGDMQRLAVSAPEVARALLVDNMQLALALEHAEFLVGLLEDPSLPTDAEVKERAKSVREAIWKGGKPNLPQKLDPTKQVHPQVPGMIPGMVLPGAFPGFMPGMAAFPGQRMMAPGLIPAGPALIPPAGMPTLIPAQNSVPAAAAAAAGGPSLIPAPAGGSSSSGGGSSEEQKRELLEKLVQLSPQQIDNLPDDQKVMLLEFLQTLPAA
eukprot:TRINITY_DN8705_c0_g2_i1.p1 TRINITY_DN8705_c0_g2~~TRINITY_DN8705_c0_g2_i1.p1  ORF type:complete len:380 (-),score=127.87 TRINITY_DN8705_c0_g2_i1:132-1271(-)